MLTLLIFLAVLSLLVFVHEFGHFITAKKSGMRVQEFGFGFPPRIFSWTRGETVYSINWIPIGGFVKIKGESGEAADEHDSFAGKPVWRRMFVVVAGVAMNFVLAAALLSLGFGIGMPTVVDDLPAHARIRDQKLFVSDVLDGTPAAQAGLAAGDRIQTINGQSVGTVAAFKQAIREHPVEAATVVVYRDGANQTLSATPAVLKETGEPGLGVALVATGVVSFPWYEAPLRGTLAAAALTRDIVASLGGLVKGLFRGHVSADLSGPVGIAVLTGEVARSGLLALLQFVAVLSVNLAVVNLIPFPALDGGRLLFLAIEAVLRRPVPKRWESAAHQVGFALLIALVILITLRDLGRFGGPILQSFRKLVE